MCAHGMLSRPRGKNGKLRHKFYWSLLPNRSISHEGSWFPKGDMSIQTPVAGDFIVWPHKYFHGTQSPLYHGFDFLAHFRYRWLYLRHFLSLTCILCIKIKIQPELHVLSKGMRIAIRSGGIQRCRRTIHWVWVLANQKARLRSWAGFGRHTAFINEPCAIRKPDSIFLFTHTVVRSIECATSMI